MWLSGQYKRPADVGEGQTGIVTVGGGAPAVLLDRERRGLEVYAPGGYRWTPQAGQRALVIQGQGEAPCVVGVRQGGGTPDSAGIQAKSVEIGGEGVSLRAGGTATVAGQTVALEGEITVNGVPLEEYIAQIVARMLMGGGA